MTEAAVEQKKKKSGLDPFRSFELSEKLVSDGTWIEVPDTLSESKFSVLVSLPTEENTEYLKEIERLAQEARETDGGADLVVYNELQVEAFANTCIRDWKDFEVNGSPFPCTKANIATLRERAPVFVKRIYNRALDIRKFLKSKEEILEKNS